MKKLAYDMERIAHINFLMDNIHEKTSEIYESLVDREYDELVESIDDLIMQLNEIKNSLNNEGL
jgi:hypothetical protein